MEDKDFRKWEVEQIANTQDTGDPVIRVSIGDSVMEVIIDNKGESLNVWRVETEKKGDMKTMLDGLVSFFGYDWVQFLAPMETEEKDFVNKVISKLEEDEEFDNDNLSAKFESEQDFTHLTDVLDGFQKVTEEHDGEEVPMLVGFWETS